MSNILYFVFISIAYVICLVKLKNQTERDRVKEAYIFWTTLVFFAIFEYFFLPSLLKNVGFHLLGLFLSILYALSIYIYLKSIKKNIDVIFLKLLEQGQGKISILSFMQYTQLSQEKSQEYLNYKLRELKGNRYTTRGNIYYEFSRW